MTSDLAKTIRENYRSALARYRRALFEKGE